MKGFAFLPIIRRMVTIATDLSTKIKTNDGHEIPLFGLGTYKCASGEGGAAETAVIEAVKNGYKLIDTAQYYENEDDVGRGITKSGVPREELYVVTKLWNHGYDACKESFKESLRKLNTGYIDLFLIHNPRGGKNIESYDAMLELQKEGLIRSVGVSNFNIHHLEALKQAGRPTPAVNQVELHPYCRYEELVKYCRENNIVVMGYSPLGRAKYFNDPKVIEVATRYNKTPAHVFLRWSVQLGYITIPKSDKPDRIISNTKIFDFALTEDDMNVLNSRPCQMVTNNRLDVPWEG